MEKHQKPKKPKPAKAEKPDPSLSKGVLVIVDKAGLEQYAGQPWVDVAAAVSRQYVQTDSYPTKVFPPRRQKMVDGVPAPGEWELIPGWEDWDTLAFLRRGDSGILKDVAILLQQNW